MTERTIYVTIRGDSRSLRRAVKAAEARVSDVERPAVSELQRLVNWWAIRKLLEGS